MKQGKFLPGLLLIGAILIAIFAIYTFAGISSVTQNSPVALNWSSSRNNSFSCTAITGNGTAANQLNNLTLWLGLTSTNALVHNQTNTSTLAGANNTAYTFSVTNMPEGNWTWACEASNVSENSSEINVVMRSANRTIVVDLTKPTTITLGGVADKLNTTSTLFNFSWTAIDNLATEFYCNITLDSVVNNSNTEGNQSGISVINGSSKLWGITSALADGTHLWNVSCWDPTNATSNTSETRSFIVDASAPETFVANIPNGSWWDSAAVNFNWTATNTGNDVLYCNVTISSEYAINGSINSSTRTVTSGVMASYSVTGLANGMHTWYANCSTYLGTWNTTGTILTTIQSIWTDVAKPSMVNLSGVAQGLNTSATTLNFSWTAIDNLASTFYCNFTLDGKVNNTLIAGNVTGISVVNATMEYWNIKNIPDGTHLWNVSCWDPVNTTLHTNTSETRHFIVDKVAPSRIAPNIANGTNFSSSTVSINWTATDASSTVVNCSLVVDDVLNLTAWYATSASGTLISQSVTGLGEGQHTWYSNCTDIVGNKNSTGTFADYGDKKRAFYVDLTDPVITLSLSSTAINVRATETVTCTATDKNSGGASVANPASFTVTLPNGETVTPTSSVFTDTSLVGTYTVTCSATDSSGRSPSPTTLTFTVGSDVNTNVGGSSGSSSSSSATASASSTLSVSPDAPAIMTVSNSNIAVNEVALDVSEAASNVKVTVAAVNILPSTTPASEGTVYKYVQITKSNLDDAKLNSAKISFFVTKAWLTEKGLDSSDVELKRYTTQWVSLPTIVKTSDAIKVYFEATTPGFSYFAISVKEAAEAPVEEETPAEETSAEEVPAEEVPAEQAPVEPVAKKSNIWMFVLLGLVVVGVIVALVVMKRKK